MVRTAGIFDEFLAGCQPEADFPEVAVETRSVDLESFKVSESLAKDIVNGLKMITGIG